MKYLLQMKDAKKDIGYAIFSGLLSLILANLGAIIIKEFPNQPYLGIMVIILAFLILYFSSYSQ